MTDTLEKLANEVRLASDEIVGKVKPLLAGKPPELQGFVIADLLAIFLAGHICEGDSDLQRDARLQVLNWHIRTVHMLIDLYDQRRKEGGPGPWETIQ